MKSLIASDLMHRLTSASLPPGIELVSPTTPVSTLVQRLEHQEMDVFLVVDEGHVVGIVRPRDLMNAIARRDMEPEPTSEPAPALVLKLRKIDTQEKLHGEFATMEDAEQWLRERPHGMEVLGVVRPVLSSEEEHRLHEAMRPLDASERALQTDRDAEDERARLASLEAMQAIHLQGSIPEDGASHDT